MAKYLVLIRVIIRNNDNDLIIQEITHKKTIDCNPSELKAEISKKEDFLRKSFIKIWEEDRDASIDIVVMQVIPL